MTLKMPPCCLSHFLAKLSSPCKQGHLSMVARAQAGFTVLFIKTPPVMQKEALNSPSRAPAAMETMKHLPKAPAPAAHFYALALPDVWTFKSCAPRGHCHKEGQLMLEFSSRRFERLNLIVHTHNPNIQESCARCITEFEANKSYIVSLCAKNPKCEKFWRFHF